MVIVGSVLYIVGKKLQPKGEIKGKASIFDKIEASVAKGFLLN